MKTKQTAKERQQIQALLDERKTRTLTVEVPDVIHAIVVAAAKWFEGGNLDLYLRKLIKEAARMDLECMAADFIEMRANAKNGGRK